MGMHSLRDYIICPYCGNPVRVIRVHGHGQCSVCHTVIDECCRGEQIEQTERKQKDHDQNIQKDPAD